MSQKKISIILSPGECFRLPVSCSISISESWRNLRSGCRLQEHINAVCRASYNQHHQLRPVDHLLAVAFHLDDNCPGVHFMSPWLLQFTAVWSNSNVFHTVVPRTHKFGNRSLSAAGPRLWNDFSPELRWPELSFPMFRQKLKTYNCSTTAVGDFSVLFTRCINSIYTYVYVETRTLQSDCVRKSRPNYGVFVTPLN